MNEANDIQGPEDVLPLAGSHLELLCKQYAIMHEPIPDMIPAEHVGQIISLAMDAEKAVYQDDGDVTKGRFEASCKRADAWRALADRLKGEDK